MNYVQLNSSVYTDPNLADKDVRLLGVLVLKFNQFRLKGDELRISNGEMAKLLNCSIRTIIRCIQNLETHGYIKITRNRKSNVNEVNKYQLTGKAIPHPNTLKSWVEYQNRPENVEKRQKWLEEHRAKPVKIPDWYENGEDIDSWFDMNKGC